MNDDDLKLKQQLQDRLAGLRKEFEAGQARLRQLETDQAFVRETLLRISGAIQVLQEMVGSESGEDHQQAGTT